ncbi:hypothetical protein BJ322DRAFT_705137 [Thelephora terrestris]|uniref:Uncharacterized protein n=1 Tax=Thelephora terrestris TaxID=56493 RepID=A0A9P6L8W1_9AGAM|nr:hypothetical protein BJ322DRAFT_705137 [Thelephora terrestris]
MSSPSIPHSWQSSSTDKTATFVPSSSSSQPPSSSALSPSPTLTSEPSPTSGPLTLSVITRSSDPKSSQSFRVPTSSIVTHSGTYSSTLSPPSILNPTPTESTNQNDAFTSLTQLGSGNTGVPDSSAAQGFFGNRGAVVGTFTVVGVAVVVALLMTFMCRRQYRRNKQRQAQTRDIDTPRPRVQDDPFADDPFARHNPHDLDATPEDHSEWETHHVDTQAEKNGLQHRRDRGLGDPLERRAYRAMPHSPPNGKGPTAMNRSSAITQSKTYFPFTNSRRISQTPSSPFTDPATLSIVDDDSAYQLSIPMSVACPRTAAILDRSRSTDAERPSSYIVPAKLETSTIPLDDQGISGVTTQESSSSGDRRVPPPIPLKGPFRTAISMQPMYTKRPLE